MTSQEPLSKKKIFEAGDFMFLESSVKEAIQNALNEIENELSNECNCEYMPENNSVLGLTMVCPTCFAMTVVKNRFIKYFGTELLEDKNGKM